MRNPKAGLAAYLLLRGEGNSEDATSPAESASCLTPGVLHEVLECALSVTHNAARVGRAFTLRRVLVGWLLFCVCGWLIAWAALDAQEDQCRARDEWLCFSDRDILVLVGVPAAAVLVGGMLVIAVVGKIVGVARRLRT